MKWRGGGGKEFRIPCFGKPEEPLCLKDFGTERDGSVFLHEGSYFCQLPGIHCDFSEVLLSVTSNY